ncbi:uncharacterized protein LOC111716896 [Eurytemora carolleeae]|uniref:uncharacterized protein LOC111716896 n=1 Tax=Eurytemora carolleeae TaxID=1294199 RepID=UPI000C756525|nr:uncharacterized protein LOC111716896 [Eurytemora carolleeae]|eukprot:XP_023348177.1 uncharacterized protein LOC111716896 [Eurytemora affinis]
MDPDTEEYVRRIQTLNSIKDRYNFTTTLKSKISPDLMLWNFIRDEEYKVESSSFIEIMEAEKSWEKLRYSKILIQSHIVNFNSAQDLLNQMAAKNFAISHFLKICIEDNLLPYPSDTVSFIHDLNYSYQLLKLVKDIESTNERVRRRVNGQTEEFWVVYAKIGPEPVTIQVHASGIPSPRYEWYYRPNDEPGSPSEEFKWTILQVNQYF